MSTSGHDMAIALPNLQQLWSPEQDWEKIKPVNSPAQMGQGLIMWFPYSLSSYWVLGRERHLSYNL